MFSTAKLCDVVIEQLVDSDFIPGKHEAYAYIVDTVLPGGCRVSDFFHRQIEQLNWEEIEAAVENKEL